MAKQSRERADYAEKESQAKQTSQAAAPKAAATPAVAKQEEPTPTLPPAPPTPPTTVAAEPPKAPSAPPRSVPLTHEASGKTCTVPNHHDGYGACQYCKHCGYKIRPQDMGQPCTARKQPTK